jgi:hypothetical protein
MRRLPLLLLLLSGCASGTVPPEAAWNRVVWRSFHQVWDVDPSIAEVEVLGDGRAHLTYQPTHSASHQPAAQDRSLVLDATQRERLVELLRKADDLRSLPAPELSAEHPDLPAQKSERREIRLTCEPTHGAAWTLVRAQFGTATHPDLKQQLEAIDGFFKNLLWPDSGRKASEMLEEIQRRISGK